MGRKNLMTLLLYLLALPVGLAAYVTSRGDQGNGHLAYALFILLAVAYAAMLTASTSHWYSVHPLLHLPLYEAACYGAADYDSELKGLAGLMVIALMYFVVGVILFGVIVNAAATAIMAAHRRQSQRKQRGTPGGDSGPGSPAETQGETT